MKNIFMANIERRIFPCVNEILQFHEDIHSHIPTSHFPSFLLNSLLEILSHIIEPSKPISLTSTFLISWIISLLLFILPIIGKSKHDSHLTDPSYIIQLKTILIQMPSFMYNSVTYVRYHHYGGLQGRSDDGASMKAQKSSVAVLTLRSWFYYLLFYNFLSDPSGLFKSLYLNVVDRTRNANSAFAF